MSKDDDHIPGDLEYPGDDALPQMPVPVVRTAGRPPALVPDEQTIAQFHLFGRFLLTREEIAQWYGLNESTVRKFLGRHPEVETAYIQGEAASKISLKRRQYVMALRDPKMSIWLGKQHLKQVDKVEQTSNTNVTISIEELQARTRELVKKAKLISSPRKVPDAPSE